MKRIGALVVIAFLVLGSLSAVVLNQPVGTTTGTTPVTGQVIATPTGGANFEALLTQGDQDAAKGDWASVISLYRAYLSQGQNATNADVHFKLGKAYLNSAPPDYIQGMSELQQATNINPNGSFAQEAKTLIANNQDKASTAVAIAKNTTPSPSLTAGTSGTAGISSTVTTSTAAITATTGTSETSATTMAPAISTATVSGSTIAPSTPGGVSPSTPTKAP